MEYLDFIVQTQKDLRRVGKLVLINENVSLVGVWHCHREQNQLIYFNPTGKLYKITFCLNGNEGDADELFFSLGFNNTKELFSALQSQGSFTDKILHRLALICITSDNGFGDLNSYLSSSHIKSHLIDQHEEIICVSRIPRTASPLLIVYHSSFDVIEEKTGFVIKDVQPLEGSAEERPELLRFMRQFFLAVVETTDIHSMCRTYSD